MAQVATVVWIPTLATLPASGTVELLCCQKKKKEKKGAREMHDDPRLLFWMESIFLPHVLTSYKYNLAKEPTTHS